ncbi:glycoside hydrolase [Rahnella sp. SL6]|uniref:glycoside hydrolase family 28 protein n=1 Tax=Rahnella perminowiae TaxID=2816244 RepID=UPI001C270AAC|nr:glycosyl hydrolase family 28 protein [Rahnella perminowiae]MBU9808361.1 glycoside hydrolase [Rahnella perminowiae]MCX2946218.1 glycosyl hydrolase family 28 protein [Rahnella perminowiae]
MKINLFSLSLSISFYLFNFPLHAAAIRCLPQNWGAHPNSNYTATKAIQRAIDSCSAAGGGIVMLSSGDWISGPLLLKNGVNLHLSAGSQLLANYDGSAFSPAFISYPAHFGEAFILAKKVNHVSITGTGIIDGQGQIKWWPLATKAREHLKQGDTRWFEKRYPGIPPANGMPRPWLIEFDHVKHGDVSNVAIKNSPMWNLVIRNSKNIRVSDSTINNPANSPNTDGVDIVSSQNVVLKKLDISTGDDDISIKSGLTKLSVNGQTSGVNISDIHVEHGHGISIGSETANHITHINMNNLFFTGTQNGVRIKSGRDRGSSITLIEVSHVEMKDVDTPLVITDSYGGNGGYSENSLDQLIKAPVTEMTPWIKNIKIEHVHAIGAKYAGIISGLPEAPLLNILLSSVVIESDHGLQSRYVFGTQKYVRLESTKDAAQRFGPDCHWEGAIPSA